MKRVLIPTDFSDNSNVALDYALQLFKKTSCCFYILNTYDQIMSSDYFDLAAATNVKTLQMLKQNSEDQLKKIKQQLENNALSNSQQCKIISQVGSLTSVVKQLVNKEAIEVIIMGTKGETSSSNIVFGSNTLHVINKRVAPVVAVPTGYKFSPIKNVLFPTDLYVKFTDKHLKFIAALAKQEKSKITLLHKIFRGLNAVQRTNKEILENYLADIHTSFEIIEDSEIDKAVYDYEQAHPSELLVMINNKHSFLENLFLTPVVSKVMKQTRIPFLVIPS